MDQKINNPVEEAIKGLDEKREQSRRVVVIGFLRIGDIHHKTPSNIKRRVGYVL